MAHEKLFLALLGSSSAHAEASRKAFNALGLTEGQPKILYILQNQDGQVQKELAAVCGIKQSTLAVLLGKMEKQNLIYKEVCYVSGMKRAYKIFLTEKGRDIAEHLYKVVEELEEKSFAGFSPEEKATLLSLLSKVEYNMQK
ncbi:MarR family transcriptional regulator [Clostridium sp. C8-1-8]|uniref:MarR family winged helix-turn-helix transcriptional regulator n=1 Tax=Clostridium sp. C8-1-8 TaxID=2698831 RepID=UPI00136E7782|nr:MarR family transcriptional regulator [Clostridium sp. C8-1-8]